MFHCLARFPGLSQFLRSWGTTARRSRRSVRGTWRTSTPLNNTLPAQRGEICYSTHLDNHFIRVHPISETIQPSICRWERRKKRDNLITHLPICGKQNPGCTVKIWKICPWWIEDMPEFETMCTSTPVILYNVTVTYIHNHIYDCLCVCIYIYT